MREGEYQRTDGRHRYRYIDEDGKEKKVYSWRLDKNDRPMVALHWEKYLQHIVEKYNNPMVAMHWEKYFQHICQKYNSIYKVQLPKITPHICRHTYCTNMARRRMNPKTLQYLMGHSDISVTLGVYTHMGLDDAITELNRINEVKSS